MNKQEAIQRLIDAKSLIAKADELLADALTAFPPRQKKKRPLAHRCDRCNIVVGTGKIADETFLCNPCLQIALEEAAPQKETP